MKRLLIALALVIAVSCGEKLSAAICFNDLNMRQVWDFEEVREALGYDRWFLLGHSFGGVLQMEYWERHPDRFAKALL